MVRTNPFLLLQHAVLDELVDQREHDGVGRGLDGEALARRQGQEDARSQDEEEHGGCQKISPHLFVLFRENLPKHQGVVVRTLLER